MTSDPGGSRSSGPWYASEPSTAPIPVIGAGPSRRARHGGGGGNKKRNVIVAAVIAVIVAVTDPTEGTNGCGGGSGCGPGSAGAGTAVNGLTNRLSVATFFVALSSDL